MSVGGRELDLGQGPGPSPGPPTTSPMCPTVATMPFPGMTNMPTIHPDRDLPNCNMPALAIAPVAIS